MGDIPSKDERESGVLYQHSVYPASLIEQVSAVEIKGVRFVKERTCSLFCRANFGTLEGVKLALYECSECGEQIEPKDEWNYCPNCGARVMHDE